MRSILLVSLFVFSSCSSFKSDIGPFHADAGPIQPLVEEIQWACTMVPDYSCEVISVAAQMWLADIANPDVCDTINDYLLDTSLEHNVACDPELGPIIF